MVTYDAFVAMPDGVELCTEVCLRVRGCTYPVVFLRSPYCPSDPAADNGVKGLATVFVDRGYAVVHQHCRGTGRSQGDFLPFQDDRRDGLETLGWIRRQPFYNGEIFLFGGSYLSAVHLAYLDPPPPDVKGAVLQVFDADRYTAIYRNGFLKMGFAVDWFMRMYKRGSMPVKNFIYPDSLGMRPLSALAKAVTG